MAVIIVETGAIVPGANSYVSVAELEQYAEDRGITLTGDPSVLLIRAMDYLESLSYQGRKVDCEQSLQWPRSCVRIDCRAFPNDEIPQQLKNAQMALAVSIDQGNDPTATSTQSVKREKVDVIEVEYMDGSTSTPIIKSVSIQLQKLLLNGSNGGNVINVYRG